MRNQHLAKNNANDGFVWVDPPAGGGTGLPAGGSANQHLAKNAANTGYVWVDPPTGSSGSSSHSTASCR